MSFFPHPVKQRGRGGRGVIRHCQTGTSETNNWESFKGGAILRPATRGSVVTISSTLCFVIG